MALTLVMGHAAFDERRRDMLPSIVASWEGGVGGVVADHERRGSWSTMRQCWGEALSLSGGRGHVGAIQDDFRCAAGGFARMQALCDLNPDAVMCFRWDASNEVALHRRCEREDALWGRSSHMWTGGATVLPASTAEHFLTWVETLDAHLRVPRPHSDDTRLEAFCMAHDIEIVRCRYSFLRHEGKWSVCHDGERAGDDEELALVTDVDALPPLSDPRWVIGGDVPSALFVPDSFREVVDVVLGEDADLVGLGHLRRDRGRARSLLHRLRRACNW